MPLFHPVPRYARISDEELARRLAAAKEVVLGYYPELSSVPFEVRLSRSQSAAGYFRRPARVGERPLIYLHRSVVRAEEAECGKVLAHEMGHLLQYSEPDWPGGEKACDLIWIARCGSRFPRPPVYLSIGRKRAEWALYAMEGERLAREAWRQRSAGTRKYIAWWESELRRTALRPLPSPTVGCRDRSAASAAP